MALVDALGNLARFVLLPGQRHDSVAVEPLIEDIEVLALLADKAFDIDWLRAEVNNRGVQAVISAEGKPQASHRLRLPYVPLAPSDRKLLL